MNVLFTYNLVGDEIEFAERPSPKFQKLVADVPVLLPKKKGQ